MIVGFQLNETMARGETSLGADLDNRSIAQSRLLPLSFEIPLLLGCIISP